MIDAFKIPGKKDHRSNLDHLPTTNNFKQRPPHYKDHSSSTITYQLRPHVTKTTYPHMILIMVSC